MNIRANSVDLDSRADLDYVVIFCNRYQHPVKHLLGTFFAFAKKMWVSLMESLSVDSDRDSDRGSIRDNF